MSGVHVAIKVGWGQHEQAAIIAMVRLVEACLDADDLPERVRANADVAAALLEELGDGKHPPG